MFKEFGHLVRWIVYRRADKTPVHPEGLYAIDAQDVRNWMTGENAQKWCDFLGDGYGVGYVITQGCGVACIDIDKALLPDNTWSPLAKELCNRFSGAYIEVSQSGRALHIFFSYRNEMPAHRKKNVPLHIEFYTELRFIGVTGTSATGSAKFDATEIVPKLIADYFPPGAQLDPDGDGWTVEPHSSWDGPADDDELIKRMCASRSAGKAFGMKASAGDLFNADAAVLGAIYPSATGKEYDGSSTDQALANHLAFWTGGNCERMLAIMDRSGLKRDKWESRPGYLRGTIAKAAAWQTVYYKQHDAGTADTAPVIAATAPAPVIGPVIAPNGVVIPPPPDHAPIEPGPAVGAGAMLTAAAQAIVFEGCMYIKDIAEIMLPEGDTNDKSRFDNDARFARRSYVVSRDGTAPTDSAWEAYLQSKIAVFPQVSSTVFEPREPQGAIMYRNGKSYINTWRPLDIAATLGDPSPYTDHIKKLFPNGDDAEIYISFCAACVQYLGFKAAWALFVQGTPGNGKSFLTKVLSYCLGEEYVHSAQASNLDNHFNGYLYRKLLICVEEVMTTEGKASTWEKLKTMITELRQEIEQKGVDQITREVCYNMIFNSNHKDGLRKTEDDRRICPLYAAQQSLADLNRDGMDEVYFIRLWDWFNGGGNAIILHHLRTVKIQDKYNFATGARRAPKTTSTDEAINAGLGSVEQDVLEAVKAQRDGFKGGWINGDALHLWLAESGKGKFLARNKRRDMLATLGYIPHPLLVDGRMPIAMNDGKKPTMYVQRGSVNATVREPKLIKMLYENAQKA